MTSGAAAARYARALFDVARQERADLEGLNRQLSDFVRLVAAHEPLTRALSNPAIPISRKRAVIDALLARAPTAPPMLAKLLRMLADRDRLVLLAQIAAAFDARLLQERRVVRAELVTAMELPADRIAALRDGLGRATGREVHLATRVDPSILGGAVARIGSTVYDGSVTRQLEKLRDALVSAAE